MKKFILVGLLLSANIVFCPDDVNKVEQLTASQGDDAEAIAKYWEKQKNINLSLGLEAQYKEKQMTEEEQLEKDLKRYKKKTLKVKQRDKIALLRNWDESYGKDVARTKPKISFAPDVIDKGEFNPRDVSTWDLNRLKKITVEDIGSLPVDQVEKLLQKSDYLKSFGDKALQAIKPEMFLKLPSEELVAHILDDEEISKKFSKEQILAMKIRLNMNTVAGLDSLSDDDIALLLNTPELLDDLQPEQLQAIDPITILKLSSERLIDSIANYTKISEKFSKKQIVAMKIGMRLYSLDNASLRALLNTPELLNRLDPDLIQNINPKLLSDVLYHKLDNTLDDDFVNKLSDEQIGQIYNDHVAWGFHNWGTAFKHNFTPEALKYIESYKDPLFSLNRLPKLKK